MTPRLTAPRSEEAAYWDEALAATSVPEASADSSPWAEPAAPAPETFGAAALDRPSDHPLGNTPAPADEPVRRESGFSFGALTDLEEGLTDPWTRDLFAGLLGPARPAARSSGSGQTARELSENTASGMGMLGSGSAAAPPSAGSTPASNPVAAASAATVPDEALLSALVSLSVVPSPAAAPTAATLGTPTGSGGSGSNGPPPPSSSRSHHGVAHGRGPLHSKDPLWVIDVNKGVVANANASTGFTLHDFSTWSVHLIAQVSGATANSYSWTLPADAAGVTITNGYDLTFTWQASPPARERRGPKP